MKLQSSIKSCPIATVQNGWIQASSKGAVYVEYLAKAKGLEFAVDARGLIDALSILKDDYTIVINKEKEYVSFFNENQEFQLEFQRPEIMLNRPTSGWIKGNVASPWMTLNHYASAQFPAIRITKDYMEALTNESIVRIKHDFTEVIEHNVVICKIPKNSTYYTFNTPRFLWLAYTETCFVALNYIGIDLPETDKFFEEWKIGKIIPKEVLPRLTLAETVTFTGRGLKLHTDEVSDVYIEDIEGKGKYSYPLFKKYLQQGVTWYFDEGTLKVTGNNIKMILEDLEAL